MDAAPIIVTQASAVADLPGVLRRGQGHFEAYPRGGRPAGSGARLSAVLVPELEGELIEAGGRSTTP